jgi:hypothetical protein
MALKLLEKSNMSSIFGNVIGNCLTPYCCSNKTIKVLSPIIRTPHHIGILNSMFRAKAVPITTKSKQPP